MALVYADSFEHRSLGRYPSKGGNTSFQTGRRGGYGLRVADTGVGSDYSGAYQNISPGDNTLIFGVAVKVTSFSGGRFWGTTTFYSQSGNGRFYFQATSGGFRLTDGGTTRVTGTTPITPGKWYWVEAKVVQHASAGYMELRVNGAVEGTPYSGPTDTNTPTLFGGGTTADGGIGDCVVDDAVLMDGTGSTMNDFLGDIYVQYILPNADSSTIELTGSDGDTIDNYDLVNEATPSTSDYVGSNVHGHRDLYNLVSLSSQASWRVHGGTLWGYVGRQTGSAAYGRVISETTGGTVTAADIIGLSTSYTYQTLSLSDYGGSTWTPERLSNLKVGFQAFTSTSS